MQYYDGEGNIVMPKSVRSIIDYKQTSLGNNKGAKGQFRYRNLHIRGYDDYYAVHRDNIDPRKHPLGHLLVDAPEYLASGFRNDITSINGFFSKGRYELT